MEPPAPDSTRVLEQLHRVLASPAFHNAERSSRLLRYLVEQTVAGNGSSLKEYTIGSEALGRGPSFDPRIDAIARVEVSRLRSRLEQYYATLGKLDEIAFVLPRGSYVPSFEIRPPVSPSATSVRPAFSRGHLFWFALGAAAASLAALLLWRFALQTRPADDRGAHPLALEVELGPDVRLANVVGAQLALAPDASAIVFVAEGPSGGSELHLRRLDGSHGTRLTGTEGARNPFFSPDGQWIAFWSNGKVKKLSIAGGSPMALCDAPDLLGGSWAEDGSIIATLTAEPKLWRIAASGGPPRPAIDLSPEPLRLMWPQLLPGSRSAIVSNVSLTPDAGSIDAVSLDSGKRKTLVRNGTYGRFLPGGHLLYINQGTLYAQAFDPDALEVRGAPAAVLQDVAYSPTFGFAQFEISRTGTLVYRRAASGNFTLQWMTRGGALDPLLPSPGPLLWPRVSPDGDTVAFSRLESGESRVWTVDRRGQDLRPATPPSRFYTSPVWSPDGRILVVQGRRSLEWLPFSSSQPPRTLLRDVVAVPWSFTPDGRRLAFYQMSPETHFDLWTLPLNNNNGALEPGTPEPFLKTKAVETYPTFSPDGRWIAYVSLQSGAYEVYVRAFPDNGAEVKVSKAGGRLPFWIKGRPEILYETENHRLMVVSWRVRDGRFEPGTPEPWSNVPLGDTGVLPNFDIAPDGRVSALLPATAPDQPQNHVTFRLNFAAEVRRHLQP